MPKVADVGPYRLYFYSSDGDEPPHVHVDRNSYSAKYWLRPVRLAYNHGFSRHELARIYGVAQPGQPRAEGDFPKADAICRLPGGRYCRKPASSFSPV
jgi:hypothetical protein